MGQWGGAVAAMGIFFVSLQGACSVMAHSHGHSWTPQRAPTCSTAKLPRVADLGLAAASFTAGVAAALCFHEDCETPRETYIGGGVALAALGSILYGFAQVRRCHEARASHRNALVKARQSPKDAPPKAKPRDPVLEAKCGPTLRRWRAEKDLVAKTKLYDELPAECQALLSHPQ